MRQASWIAFLLMALGIVSYEAALDRQETSGQSAMTVGREPALDGGGGWPSPAPSTLDGGGGWPSPTPRP